MEELPAMNTDRLHDSIDTTVPEMTFSSSPIEYPLSSSPAPTTTAAIKQKRKLFQSFAKIPAQNKKPRLSDITELEQTVPVEEVTVQIQQQEVESTILQHAHTGFIQDEDLDNTTGPVLDTSTLISASIKTRDISISTSYGGSFTLRQRKKQEHKTYEQVISERSVTAEGKAKRSYYGIDIHTLVNEAKALHELEKLGKEAQAERMLDEQTPARSIEPVAPVQQQMWTEKYRAKRFTDLVGDERTHRQVLRWLKAWDKIVFPGNVKKPAKKVYEDNTAEQDYQHRKILLLTGPPGLGKTTLAHVCAKQAGYEALEINASDDRSRDVVKGRIKDALATETVRGVKEHGQSRRAGRPVCVVVDEVDGVTSGSGGGGGEGGFMKALVDLVHLDQKNSQPQSSTTSKKGDKFRQLRPLILICNDVYAPSLRPLRTSGIAEIIHVRKPPLDKVIARLKSVFEKEKIPHDNDAIRRLCETAWGLGTRKQNTIGARGTCDGDIRSVLVQSEWLAHKLRSTSLDNDAFRMSRKWVELQVGDSSSNNQAFARGGVREIVERIFIEGAGLATVPQKVTADEARLISETKRTPTGVADQRKRSAITALRQMIDTTGDHDRLVTDCFATYPTQVFQDDTFLSKPTASYDWLHFHDSLSSRIFSGQEWELNPYLSTAPCAFHDLFASLDKGSQAHQAKDSEESTESTHPFANARADFAAHEAMRANQTHLTSLQSNFSGPLLRLFSSTDNIALELIPNLMTILAPDVKPVVVNGSNNSGSVASVRKESEKNCISTSVRVMHALGIEFDKVRIEDSSTNSFGTSSGFAYRMEPPIDELGSFHMSHHPCSSTSDNTAPTRPNAVRYAVRQVLDQELRKTKILAASQAKTARATGPLTSSALSDVEGADKENSKPLTIDSAIIAAPVKVKRDFFGRPITIAPAPSGKIDAAQVAQATASRKGKVVPGTGAGAAETHTVGARTWVSFHEGFSNAVRKPITLKELLDGF